MCILHFFVSRALLVVEIQGFNNIVILDFGYYLLPAYLLSFIIVLQISIFQMLRCIIFLGFSFVEDSFQTFEVKLYNLKLPTCTGKYI